MEWLIVIAVLTGLWFTWNLRSKTGLTLAGWFIICLGPGNALLFTYVILVTMHGKNDLWEKWIQPHKSSFWIVPLLILLAETGAWFGAVLGKPRRTHNPATVSRAIELRRMYWLSWALLLGGIVALWLYSRVYGGFIGLLVYRTSLYYTGIELPNPWSFMLRIGGLFCFASLLFSGLLFEGKVLGYNRYAVVLGFILSIFFSLLFWFILAGRMLLTTYVVMFIVAYFAIRGRSTRWVSLASLTGLVLILPLVYWVTLIVAPGKFENTIESFFAKELSFPTACILTAIENSQTRYGIDILTAPMHFLPQRITVGILDIETASDVLTQIFLGAPKGKGATYGIPVDALTFSFLQAGVYGVVLLPFMFSYLLGWLEKFILQIPIRSLSIVLHLYAGLFIAAMSAFAADPEHIIRRNWHFFVGIILLHLAMSAAKRAPSIKTQAESES